MTRPPVRLALLLFALGACSARQPPEAPVRILDLDRSVSIVLRSDPPGLSVFELHENGGRGAMLGATPVVIDQVPIHKEVWKHGDRAPAVPTAGEVGLVEERRIKSAASRYASGSPLRFTVVVETRDGVPHRADFELALDQLASAFSAGRIELEFVVPAPEPLAR